VEAPAAEGGSSAPPRDVSSSRLCQRLVIERGALDPPRFQKEQRNFRNLSGFLLTTGALVAPTN